MTDRDRIEHLVHSEPTIHRTLGQKVLRGLSVVCAVITLAAVGVLVFAYAELRSCTNSNFGDPAGLQKAAVAAQVAFAQATHQFAATLTAVFNTRPSSPAQMHAITDLKVDSQALRDASRTWQGATNRAYTYRTSHPLGTC